MNSINKIKTTKFPKKYYSLLFGAMVGLIMSLLTSLTVTVVNIGVVPNFFQISSKYGSIYFWLH
jgi:hypothetical protein